MRGFASGVSLRHKRAVKDSYKSVDSLPSFVVSELQLYSPTLRIAGLDYARLAVVIHLCVLNILKKVSCTVMRRLGYTFGVWLTKIAQVIASTT